MQTRARGITVQVLDLTGFNDGVNAAVAAADDEWTHGDIAGTWAIAFKGDTVYVIDTDGVGREITETDPLILDIYPSRKTETGTTGSLVPTMTLTLTLDRILGLPRTEVDLADHIRVFGARLERNYAMWRGLLTD